MIARFQKRMMLLVSAVLILVTAGIIFSINYMNWRRIVTQADAALELLAQESGDRPGLFKGESAPGNDGIEAESSSQNRTEDGLNTEGGSSFFERQDEGRPEGPGGRKGSLGLLGRIPPDGDRVLASLSNYYTALLDEEGSLVSWTSDRQDLYTDKQVSETAAAILAAGKSSGHLGTQFYRLQDRDGGRLLIVLDQQLEIISAMRLLRVTIFVAALACVLLLAASWLLIRAMIRPVQEAFDRQKQFVSDASHELKTPLAVIGANAQVLEGEIGKNEYLGYIRLEVSRADRLLQDLLSLARMDQDRLQVHMRDCDLGKTVLEAVLPFESAAFEAGRELTVDIDEGIRCSCDPDMIRQLTLILLDNALKYSDDGGRICVRVSARGKNRLIEVSNTGEGISPQALPHIFDRFYRADSSHSRQKEGYGLGLSIARSITQKHGGKIRAQSTPGEWTRFTVTLPGS